MNNEVTKYLDGIPTIPVDQLTVKHCRIMFEIILTDTDSDEISIEELQRMHLGEANVSYNTAYAFLKAINFPFRRGKYADIDELKKYYSDAKELKQSTVKINSSNATEYINSLIDLFKQMDITTTEIMEYHTVKAMLRARIKHGIKYTVEKILSWLELEALNPSNETVEYLNERYHNVLCLKSVIRFNNGIR